MRFEDLLGRADDEMLQELVGTPAVRVLRLIDPKLAVPGRLRELLLELRSPEELLRDPRIRRELLMLMPTVEAGALARDLLGSEGADPYSGLTRLRIRKGSPQERDLFRFLGVEPVLEAPPEVGEPVRSLSAEYGLFEHQRQAVRRTLGFLRSDRRRVLLHMPTGAGKTRTAMNVICDHLRAHEPGLVIWLAYSEELCEQAALEFQRAWNALGDRRLGVYRFWGDMALELGDLRDGLLVAGLSKVYNQAKGSIRWLASLADRTSLVVIDEAHQAIAESYRLVLNGIEVKQARTGLLGLTATPGRTWAERDKDDELARFFFRQKVSLETPRGLNPVEYLIDERYLARPRFVRLHHSGGVALSRKDQDDISRALDIPARVLERLAEDEVRNLAIISRVEELVRRHDRILLFGATVGHARLIAVILRARGVEAHAVTATTAAPERRKIIARYESDAQKPIVLCNYGVLTTGFDAPKTSAAVVARPTRSLVLYSQMIGRALRGPRAGGNQEAEIVTVVDPSLPGFGDLGEAFLNWEDVWK